MDGLNEFQRMRLERDLTELHQCLTNLGTTAARALARMEGKSAYEKPNQAPLQRDEQMSAVPGDSPGSHE